MTRWAAAGALAGGVATTAAIAAAAGYVAPLPALGVASLALGAATALVTVASARPDLAVFGPALCRTTHPGRLALTIDDGPDPRSTLAMVEALRRVGASATFFVLADRVRAHGGLLRELVAAGMEVGLHGREHSAALTWLPPGRGEAWIRAGLDQLAAAGAPGTRWFRPPFGAVSPRLHASVARAGLTLVWCTVRTGDGGWASRATIEARCRRAVATDVVLLHDGPGHARGLLPGLLEEWSARGILATSVGRALEA